jgi:hypothetical protein
VPAASSWGLLGLSVSVPIGGTLLSRRLGFASHTLFLDRPRGQNPDQLEWRCPSGTPPTSTLALAKPIRSRYTVCPLADSAFFRRGVEGASWFAPVFRRDFVIF